MDRHGAMRKRSVALLVVAVASLALLLPPAAAHDIPDEIHLHAFVKPEGDRLHLVVRIPLTLLLSLGLPKRGPGYLDLTQIDRGLQAATDATGREIELFENGKRLAPVRGEARISLPSDRSFETYDGALAQIRGPKLPESTDVFWNQGFFDAHLEYSIVSDRSDFSIDMRVAPGLGKRLKLTVRFLTADGGTRAYQVTGGAGRIALDPRWHQAAWVFVESGFFHILGGMDHLLFLLCLVIPFRRLGRDLLAVVTSFTVAHSITLIAAAYGLVPAGQWFPPLVEALIAASILYMALENIVAPSLGRRWLITGAFGLVHGFGFSYALAEKLQFAGSHLLVSLLSFNVGIEVGQIAVLAVTLPALALLARSAILARYAGVILSVMLAHTGWHWMLERVEVLGRTEWPTLESTSPATLARWALVLLLLVGIAWLRFSRGGGGSGTAWAMDTVRRVSRALRTAAARSMRL